MQTYPFMQQSVIINRAAKEVYQFLSNPLNLPKWAAGLSGSDLRNEGEYWVTDSPMGPVKIKFACQNDFGVLDHDVTLPSGEVNHNPLRVIANGFGCVVIFTLFRLPRMSQSDFEQDAIQVQSDLNKLKSILEE